MVYLLKSAFLTCSSIEYSQKDIVKVRSEIEKHFKANSAESEVNDAIKSIVAAANNNGETEEGEPKEVKEQAAEGTQLTNGEKATTTEATSS